MNGSHSVKNASKIRSQKKGGAIQCSHVQALMCLSKLSAVQCFLHSLHCTSRVTSGNHDLPHGWNLQSRHLASKHHPKTLYFCIFTGNLGSSTITGAFGAFRWGHFFLWLFKDVSTRWWPEAQMAINVLQVGAVDVSPPKKKGIPRSKKMPNTFWINQPCMTWCFLFF